jgi:predicted phage terminase large subunit-like protein
MEESGQKECNWEVINLPGLAEPNDPIGREVGEPLFPERFPLEKMKSIRASVGSYIWAALYTGSPVRMGGNYIPVGNFEVVDADEVPEGLRWARFWDLATTENATSDYTASPAGAFYGTGPDMVLYIRDMANFQKEWPAVRERIKLLATAECIPVGIEVVAGFKSAYQNLAEVMPSHVPLREYGVDKDKLTRALAWIAMVENGKVKLVRGPWITDFILQAEQFPAGVHDDMVDGVSGLFQMLQTVFQTPKPVKGKTRGNANRKRSDRTMIG